VSLFYNSISLHDGNRIVTADGGTRVHGGIADCKR